MIWRMVEGAERWHCCERCSRWPVEGFVEVDGRPAGLVCQECLAEQQPPPRAESPRRLLHINMQLGGRTQR